MDKYATAVDRSLPDRALPVRFKEPPPVPSFLRRHPTLSKLDVVIEAPRAEEISALSPPRRGSCSPVREGRSDEPSSHQALSRNGRREVQGDGSRSTQKFSLTKINSDASETDSAGVEASKLPPLRPLPPQPLRRAHSTSSTGTRAQGPSQHHASSRPMEHDSRRRSAAYLAELEAELQQELDAMQRRNSGTRQHRQHQRAKSMMEAWPAATPPQFHQSIRAPSMTAGYGHMSTHNQTEAPTIVRQSTGHQRAKSTMEPRPAAIPPYPRRTQSTRPAAPSIRERSMAHTFGDHDDIPKEMQPKIVRTTGGVRPAMDGNSSGNNGNES